MTNGALSNSFGSRMPLLECDRRPLRPDGPAYKKRKSRVEARLSQKI